MIQISSAIIELDYLDFLHCDIRWSNIVIDIHRDWYLIDRSMFCSSSETILRKIDPKRFVLNTCPNQLLRWSKYYEHAAIQRMIKENTTFRVSFPHIQRNKEDDVRDFHLDEAIGDS